MGFHTVGNDIFSLFIYLLSFALFPFYFIWVVVYIRYVSHSKDARPMGPWWVLPTLLSPILSSEERVCIALMSSRGEYPHLLSHSPICEPCVRAWGGARGIV